jgi:hypothetical protein
MIDYWDRLSAAFNTQPAGIEIYLSDLFKDRFTRICLQVIIGRKDRAAGMYITILLGSVSYLRRIPSLSVSAI